MDQYSNSENAIVERFRRFQPRPSPQAYARMADMPWRKPKERKSIMQVTALSRPFKSAVAVLIVAVLGAVLVMTTPSLRAFAQDLLDSLFNREASSTLVVEPPAQETTGDTPTLMGIAAVEALAGFSVAEPQPIPAGYIFAGAGYTDSRHAASLVYRRPGVELVITQQPVVYAEYGLLTDGASGIGPDAPIQTVQIAGVAGEYVAGTWITTGDNLAVWQPDAPFQRLRWQVDDMIYEILAVGGSGDTGSGLDQSALIALATSLQ